MEGRKEVKWKKEGREEKEWRAAEIRGEKIKKRSIEVEEVRHITIARGRLEAEARLKVGTEEGK